jgi:hypothetical protein
MMEASGKVSIIDKYQDVGRTFKSCQGTFATTSNTVDIDAMLMQRSLLRTFA